jgi:hypothetical protein
MADYIIGTHRRVIQIIKIMNPVIEIYIQISKKCPDYIGLDAYWLWILPGFVLAE